MLVYFNTAGYQMDSNESEFHKIPLVKKLIVEKIKNEYRISEDSEYDS
jgi:diaminopimelate decarboxylase